MKIRTTCTVVFVWEIPEELMETLRTHAIPIEHINEYPVLQDMLTGPIKAMAEDVAMVTLMANPGLARWDVDSVEFIQGDDDGEGRE